MSLNSSLYEALLEENRLLKERIDELSTDLEIAEKTILMVRKSSNYAYRVENLYTPTEIYFKYGCLLANPGNVLKAISLGLIEAYKLRSIGAYTGFQYLIPLTPLNDKVIRELIDVIGFKRGKLTYDTYLKTKFSTKSSKYRAIFYTKFPRLVRKVSRYKILKPLILSKIRNAETLKYLKSLAEFEYSLNYNKNDDQHSN